jgi:hypothetical protein
MEFEWLLVHRIGSQKEFFFAAAVCLGTRQETSQIKIGVKSLALLDRLAPQIEVNFIGAVVVAFRNEKDSLILAAKHPQKMPELPPYGFPR